MARDSPTTGRREGIVRSLVACAWRESSPKHGALRVLLGQWAVTPFHPKYAVGVDLSLGMRRIPISANQKFMFYFK
jgi:hypothetical protein